MPANANRAIVLRSRPAGEPTEDNFALVETPVPEPGAGRFLARTVYLSLAPSMRGRMSDRASYASPAEFGKPMVGGTVGQVVRSNHPAYAEGDYVLGYWGWQEYGVPFRAGSGPPGEEFRPVAGLGSRSSGDPHGQRDYAYFSGGSSGDRAAPLRNSPVIAEI